MSTNQIRVGLDDVAEGNGAVRGWGYLALDEAAAKELTARHALLLQKHGVREFHGKEYERGKDRIAYEAFADEMVAIFRQASIFHYGFAAWPDTFSASFSAFGARVTGGALSNAVPGIPAPLQILVQSQMPAMMWLLGDLTAVGLGQEHSLTVEVDASNETKDAKTQFTIKEKLMSGEQIVTLVSRSHTRVQFPDGPTVDRVTFVDSSSSALVQGADVLTNFALNHVREVGGHTTTRAAEKTAILARVVGNIEGRPELARIISVTQGTLAITDPSRLPTMRIGLE